MGNRAKLTALLAGTTLISTGITPANSQEATPGGLALSFGIASTLRINDNLGLRDPSVGTTTLWDNRLTFGVVSETPTARLGFDIGATIRTAGLPGRSTTTEIDDPFAVLSYQLESQNSLLEAQLNYSKVALSFADPLLLVDDDPDDGIDDADLVDSEGFRIVYGGRVGFETGRIDPLGYGLSYEHSSTEYEGTTDTSLYNSETNRVDGFVRLQFSPVMEGRINAFWDQYDADNPDQRSRRTIGASTSLSYEINPVTIATAELGYRKIEETTVSTSTTTIDGVTGSLRLSRDIPTGNVSAEISSGLTTSGRRNTFELAGVFERPLGEVSMGIGVTKGESGDLSWIGNLGLTHELPRGTITASIDRSVRTSDEGVDNVSTRAALEYAMDLTRVSSFAIGLDYAELTEVGTSDASSVAGLNATYSHELTPDWSIETGYEYRRRSETGEADRESNEFFVTLSRVFSVR